jgi:hypothetical protein
MLIIGEAASSQASGQQCKWKWKTLSESPAGGGLEGGAMHELSLLRRYDARAGGEGLSISMSSRSRRENDLFYVCCLSLREGRGVAGEDNFMSWGER